MAKHRHIEVNTHGERGAYSTTRQPPSPKEYRYPARNPSSHGAKLRQELQEAQAAAIQRAAGLEVRDLVLEFFGAKGTGLEAEKLDDRKASIELLSQREENGVTYATVYVPEDGIAAFLKKIEDYESKATARGEPKNKALMESLEGVRLPVVRSFWTDDPGLFPNDENEIIWWEVWLRRTDINKTGSEQIPRGFRLAATQAGLRIIPGISVFPERIVFLMHGSAAQWASSFSLLLFLAELRKASEIPVDFVQLPPKDQRQWIEAAVDRITLPPVNAPAVCIVDTGCNHVHPLLKPFIDEGDCYVVDPTWSKDDQNGHGTEIAGIAVYGSELAEILAGSSAITFSHRLESVKFLNDAAPHDPANYGNVTVESVALVEANMPDRQRIVCLMTTTDKHQGDEPQLWSSQLDQHAGGQLDDFRRLYVVSVGNIRNYWSEPYSYPESNHKEHGVEDPAQAYNVLSVGGYTDRVALSRAYSGRECIASKGSLSPLSRTSMMWDNDDWSVWPFKPDIVMEAGNYLRDVNHRPEACDDLCLLTTRLAPTGQLLTTTGDTSAAAAQAAKLAAELLADYPTLWPETVRGLIVHSAEWTQTMTDEFNGGGRESIRQRLRCYGYGVPNIERARFTLNNHVSLIMQDSLQPFIKGDSGVSTNEYKLHSLPWPKTVLEQLFSKPVTVKVTLSYYIEPSPGRRGFKNKFRYASHGLRFAVKGAAESDNAFAKRISKEAWSEEEKKSKEQRLVDRPSTGEPQSWVIGSQVRTRGSIHCDWWTSTAADIAKCGEIAIYPVTGWWKERPHLKRYESLARYALIVTLSTPDETVDLYTPIAQQVTVPISVST